MNHFEIRFSALLENVGFARTAVASYISYLNPTLDEISDLKTIVSEAVSNAIIHGYRLNGLKEVFMKVKINKREIEITIQDYGVGISNLPQVLNFAYSSKKEEEHAGMGFTIMQSLADTFDIQSNIGLGTKVVITKLLTPVLEEVY